MAPRLLGTAHETAPFRTLEVRDHLDRGGDESEVVGDGLLAHYDAHAQPFYLAFFLVRRSFAGADGGGDILAGRQCPLDETHRLGVHLAHFLQHASDLQKLLIEPFAHQPNLPVM